jgi:hypothetical protein
MGLQQVWKQFRKKQCNVCCRNAILLVLSMTRLDHLLAADLAQAMMDIVTAQEWIPTIIIRMKEK